MASIANMNNERRNQGEGGEHRAARLTRGGDNGRSIKGRTVIVKHMELLTYDSLMDRATISPASGKSLNLHVG